MQSSGPHLQKQVVQYACAIASPAFKILAMGRPTVSHNTEWSAQMTSTPDTSDAVIHASASPDLRQCSHRDAPETKAPAAEDVSAPVAFISEHRVMLGTAAATAVAPSLDDELDGADAAAKTLAAPRSSGWIATLVRLVTPSRDQRPRRRHYPARFDSDFMADARMAREMLRL
jgi:hypothetical protein